jgi:two-component system, NarL family, sensor histidine kinase EvgS
MLKIQKKFTIRTQLLGLLGLFLLSALIIFFFDEWDRQQSTQASHQLRDVSIHNIRVIKTISDTYGMEYVDTTFRVRNYLIGWKDGIRTVDNAKKIISTHWQALENSNLTAEQKRLLVNIREGRRHADATAAKLTVIFQDNDIRKLGDFADTELFPAIDPVRQSLKLMSDLELTRADQIVADEAKRVKRAAYIRAAILLLALLGLALIARNLVRNIYKGVESLRELAMHMRRHDYSVTPKFRADGELGDVLDTFLLMRDDVQRFENEFNVQLADNEEVRASLQESEVFQRSLLAAARVAVISLDLDGRITSMNPFAEKISGYHAEEMIGTYGLQKIMLNTEIKKVANDFTAALDREVPTDNRMLNYLIEHGSEPMELTLVKKDGAHVPVLLASSAMRDSTGRTIGVLGVATDLSQIKQLEKKLRTSEMTAREANVAKSNFLAAMSHEIRTPMIGVTGMLEVLSHSKLDNEQRRTMDVIQQSAGSLLQIIGDILDFSKVEAGRMDLSIAATSLSKLMLTTCDNFTDSASSKGLVMNVSIDPKIGPAYFADGLRVRQILANFLSNAIKFTDAGFIEAALEYQGKMDGKDRIRFRITDTGSGITPEQQARLFQPFQQAETSTTRKFGGTGLGLVISKRLAELMGGDIVMESSFGHGTSLSFTAEFAIANEKDIEDHSEEYKAPFRSRPLPSIQTAVEERSLILVVDDHPTNRIVVGKQLALAGFICEFAEDGEQGIAQWKTGRYALVLSDIHMPVMDGYQMSREIRNVEKSEQRRATPIIALTAAALKGDAERCFAAGMDDYLVKPVNIPRLANCIYTWLPHIKAPGLMESNTVVANIAVSPAEVTALTGKNAVCLDQRVLQEITGSDHKEMFSILNDFMQSVEQDLSTLKRALIAKDAQQVSREAHKIKGAAKLVGAMQLALAAEHLELSAKQDAASFDELTHLAQLIFARVDELQQHVDQLKKQ